MKWIAGINSANSARGLALGFALIVFVMVFLAVMAVWRFDKVKSEFEVVVDVYNARVELAQRMRVIARERSPLLFTIVNSEDPFIVDELSIALQQLGSEFLTTREALIATRLGSDEMARLEEHREFARKIVPEQRRVIDLVNAGKLEQARHLLMNEVSPAQIESLERLDAFISLEKAKSEASMSQARDSFNQTLVDIGITAVVGSLFSLIIGIFVSMRFSGFVRALEVVNEDLELKVEERTSELQDANERLTLLANYDSLTGLSNRSLFLEHLDLAIKRASRHKLQTGLLFIDLDGFKSINDTFGHDYGDELLRQVAARLLASAREEDVVSRLGGDEFTLILGEVESADAAAEVADRINNSLSKPFSVLGAECHIGSSIGIALYPEHAGDLDELIKHADTAMYRVKNSGKNSFYIHNTDVVAA